MLLMTVFLKAWFSLFLWFFVFVFWRFRVDSLFCLGLWFINFFFWLFFVYCEWLKINSSGLFLKLPNETLFHIYISLYLFIYFFVQDSMSRILLQSGFWVDSFKSSRDRQFVLFMFARVAVGTFWNCVNFLQRIHVRLFSCSFVLSFFLFLLLLTNSYCNGTAVVIFNWSSLVEWKERGGLEVGDEEGIKIEIVENVKLLLCINHADNFKVY